MDALTISTIQRHEMHTGDIKVMSTIWMPHKGWLIHYVVYDQNGNQTHYACRVWYENSPELHYQSIC